MAVTLPNVPNPWSAEPSLVDYGIDQAPAMGGAQGRAVRLGSRWAVKFAAMPDLSWSQFQVFLGAVLAAKAAGSTLIRAWPQPAFSTAIGAPVANGAGQTGNSLVVNGLAAGISLPAGIFFSVSAAGRNYLYQLAAAATADGAGNATLSLSPWLRASPAGGAALNFATPQIEGFMAPGVNWKLRMRATVTLPAFTLTELQ
jgi:hypothetical protein